MSEKKANTPATAVSSATENKPVVAASAAKPQPSIKDSTSREKPATARYAPLRKVKSKRPSTTKAQSSAIAVDPEVSSAAEAKEAVKVSTKSVKKKRVSAPKKATKVSKTVSEPTTTSAAVRSVSSKKAQKTASSEESAAKSAAVKLETGVEERGISGNALNDIYQLNLSTTSQMLELFKTESQTAIELNRRLACELLDLKAPTALPDILNNYYNATQNALHNAIENRQKVMQKLFQI